VNELKDLPKEGMLVGYGGVVYKISSVSSTYHPEFFGGKTRAKSGLSQVAQLEPAEDGAEDVSGWVPINNLKKLSQKDLSKIKFIKR
jgi:hypothetical protein